MQNFDLLSFLDHRFNNFFSRLNNFFDNFVNDFWCFCYFVHSPSFCGWLKLNWRVIIIFKPFLCLINCVFVFIKPKTLKAYFTFFKSPNCIDSWPKLIVCSLELIIQLWISYPCCMFVWIRSRFRYINLCKRFHE